jgi:potassium-transporting ATPase KdpC subunit
MKRKTIYSSIIMLIMMTVLTGLVYPLIITGLATILFPAEVKGSIIKNSDGVVIGSKLIGQETDSSIYFHPRPSATGYSTIPSGASNFSWTDKRFQSLVKERRAAFLKENYLPDSTNVPVEMLTASASGLDPHITPGAAFMQANRISTARHFDEEQAKELNDLIVKMTEKPQYSLFGEERINVFLLNLNLDKIK